MNIKILIIIMSLLLLPPITALDPDDSPYGLREDETQVSYGGNYTINVTNSYYLQGYTPTTLLTGYETYFANVFLLIDGSNANTNIDISPYNLTAGGMDLSGNLNMNTNNINNVNQLTVNQLITDGTGSLIIGGAIWELTGANFLLQSLEITQDLTMDSGQGYNFGADTWTFANADVQNALTSYSYSSSEGLVSWDEDTGDFYSNYNSYLYNLDVSSGLFTAIGDDNEVVVGNGAEFQMLGLMGADFDANHWDFNNVGLINGVNISDNSTHMNYTNLALTNQSNTFNGDVQTFNLVTGGFTADINLSTWNLAGVLSVPIIQGSSSILGNVLALGSPVFIPDVTGSGTSTLQFTDSIGTTNWGTLSADANGLKFSTSGTTKYVWFNTFKTKFGQTGTFLPTEVYFESNTNDGIYGWLPNWDSFFMNDSIRIQGDNVTIDNDVYAGSYKTKEVFNKTVVLDLYTSICGSSAMKNVYGRACDDTSAEYIIWEGIVPEDALPTNMYVEFYWGPLVTQTTGVTTASFKAFHNEFNESMVGNIPSGYTGYILWNSTLSSNEARYTLHKERLSLGNDLPSASSLLSVYLSRYTTGGDNMTGDMFIPIVAELKYESYTP